MRCVQQDHHVQSWVRERVRVLALLEELARLVALRDKREAKGYVWHGTLVNGKTVEVRSL